MIQNAFGVIGSPACCNRALMLSDILRWRRSSSLRDLRICLRRSAGSGVATRLRTEVRLRAAIAWARLRVRLWPGAAKTMATPPMATNPSTAASTIRSAVDMGYSDASSASASSRSRP